MFFADNQLMHGPMMPIFESVRAIPSMDVVQTFGRDLSSGSQVRVHTNIKKDKKRQKQMQPKLIPSVKLRFSGGKKRYYQTSWIIIYFSISQNMNILQGGNSQSTLKSALEVQKLDYKNVRLAQWNLQNKQKTRAWQN